MFNLYRYTSILLIALFLTACGSPQPAEAANKAQSIQFLLSQVRNTSGPLTGGKVYFYAAGTTTAKTVWQDRNKVTPAANPYTLDSNATAQLYGDGLYRIVIKTSALVTVYDRDYISIRDVSGNIYDVADYASLAAAVASIGSTSATLQYSTDQTLAANLTIPSTLELVPLNGAVINHGAYTINYAGGTARWPLAQIFSGTGAITFTGSTIKEAYPEWWGVDGVADDIQIDAALAAFHTVKLSNKTYELSGSVDINRDSLSLIGSGIDKTILHGPSAGTSINVGVTANVRFYTISNLTTSSNDIGMRLGHGTNQFTALDGIIKDVKTTASTTGGIFADRLTLLIMDRVYAVGNTGYGMYNLTGSVTTTITARSCVFNLNNKGLYLYQGVEHVFDTCDFSNNNDNGLETAGTNTQGIIFNACWWEGNNRVSGLGHIYLNSYPGSYSAKRILFQNCAISPPGVAAGAYSVYLNRCIGATFKSCDFYEDPWTNNNIYVQKGLGAECIGNKFVDCTPSVARSIQTVSPYSSSGQHFSIEYAVAGATYSNNLKVGKNIISAEYDFSVDGGAVGSFDFVSLPYGATITKAYYQVVTAPTSSGLASMYFGITTDAVAGLLATTAYNNAAFSVGFHDFIPSGATANFLTSTGSRTVRMQINVADLTAGKIKIWVEYSI